MTETGENVAVLVRAMAKKEKCDYKPEDTRWRCNLTGNSTALGTNLGDKPEASKESELSAGSWPSQAHHLIPHKQLNQHPVKKWLKKSSMMYADTQYDVDHRNNGKWMPYASGLKEWQRAGQKKKHDLMFKVMELSGIQLHQGRHSSKPYGMGKTGYKERVDQYLDKIRNKVATHAEGPPECEDCISNQSDKGLDPPRDNTVRYVDRASGLLEDDINKCEIFVSKIAAEFAEAGGFDA
jgi:hypothetical protein